MKAVTMGEIMLRLNPPGNLLLRQANSLEMSVAGAEANVAVSLANYGNNVSFVTKLPRNDLALSALEIIKSKGVDVSKTIFGGDRIGLLYLEKGASQRSSKVIYDRKHSSFADAKPEDFDWEKIFIDADVFHFTGITPALSENAEEICAQAVAAAKSMGLVISCDINYRSSLWSIEHATRVIQPLMEKVDICFAGIQDAKTTLGVMEGDEPGDLAEMAERICKRYGCKTVASTIRGSISANVNTWSAMLYSEGKAYFSREYKIDLVDRVGAGDAFDGAVIHTVLNGCDPSYSVEFAAAASCLKQTIEYDFNLFTIPEVEELMYGDSTGRIKR